MFKIKEGGHDPTTRKSAINPRRILLISRHRKNQSKRIIKTSIKHIYLQDWQPILRQQEVTRSMA